MMEMFETSMDVVVRVITGLTCSLLVGVAIYGVVQLVSGHIYSGGATVAVAVLVMLLAYLFSVQRYSVDEEFISIVRPIGTIRIPRSNTRVFRDAKITDGAIRVWANGGLFSIAGLFYSKQSGWLHAYMRNSKVIVAIQHDRKTYLVSPDDANRFIAAAGH